jgi:hypothetical protein
MVSNRSFLGHLFTQAHLRAANNSRPLPKPTFQIQIDTSRNLKSHLSYCKHGASLLSDRQNFGRISPQPVIHHHDPVGFHLPASNRPSRSSNVRSMLYSLYPKTHNHFAAGEIR